MEPINQYFLSKKDNIVKNWHTYLFDALFIVASFTFIPIFGLTINLLDENFFADKDDIPSQIKSAFAATFFIFIIVCRIASLYLKRFSIRKQKAESNSWTRIFKWNKFAILFLAFYF